MTYTEFYYLLIDKIPTNIAIYRAVEEGNDFIFVNFNKIAEKTESINKTAIIGKRVTEVFPGIKEFGLLDVFSRVYKTGKSEIFDLKFYHDERISGWKKNEVIKLPDGNIMAIYEDFTKEKQLEFENEDIDRRLQKSNKLLKTIIDTVPVRLFWKDTDFNYMGCNQLFAKDSGLNDEIECIGKTDYDLFLKEEADSFRKDDIAVIDTQTQKLNYLESKIDKNGSTSWLLKSKIPLRDENGKLFGVLGSYYDITEQKNAEKKLLETKERLDIAIQSTNDGMWEWDISNDITYWSPRFKEMLGYSDDELEASYETWLEIIHPDDKDNAIAETKRNLENETDIFSVTHRVKHKDGRWLWMWDRAKTYFNEDGKPIKMVGFHTDMTKQMEAEQKIKEQAESLQRLTDSLQIQIEEETSKRMQQERILIQQSKLAAMGEMIGNIAHQWRQPLNTLALQIQDMPEAYEFGEMNKEYLNEQVQVMMETIQHMSSTIDDFRNFFKPNRIKEFFSVQKAVEKSLSIVKASLKNNYIDVKVEILNDSEIFGYTNEYSQVVLNIINNARDALQNSTKNNKSILITIDKNSKEKSIVTISDNGGGIPEDINKKIFQPYFTTKHHSAGTGIGLFMSKMIIENNMNGTISVSNIKDSGNKNIGAKFEIII